MKIFLHNWYNKLLDELPRTKKLKIISPFVKEQVVRTIQSKFDLKDFELITRFNLQDFASKVSSLEGLRFAVEQGSEIHGIRNLHSKVYLFDERAAIVTSANLTDGGLRSNYECGIFITDKDIIQELVTYFDQLKNMAGESLSISMCDDWLNQISKLKIENSEIRKLPDYGKTKVFIKNEKSYYVKFFGTNDNRVDFDFSIKEEIDRALCQYACCFPENKKPRQVKDGDFIYMARMTHSPNDYAIFGRAEALAFVEGRDKPTKKELLERPWKKEWPVYLRVKNGVFIDGKMRDGILLSDLISKFDYCSFPSTLRRYEAGEKEIIPKRALMQKAYIGLTHDAAQWLDLKFNAALENVGRVDNKFLDQLPQSEVNIDS